MRSAAKNILITGLPGTGKTTLIKKLAEDLSGYEPAGFYTEEIKSRGARTGFKLTSLDGRTGILAHVNISGPHRIGKYGVDLQGFEQFLAMLPLPDRSPRLVFIDEIGKMECLSSQFRSVVMSLLDAPRPLVATIAQKGGDFVDEVKRRPDVQLYKLTDRNRNSLLTEIIDRIHSLMIKEG